MSGTYSNASCTKEGYKKLSITLAILEEFLVISLQTKIPTVDMKIKVYSKFSKHKIWKKWNLQALWGMGDFTLPSVASKNGSVVHPFSQNAKPIFVMQKFNNKK
jgi:hypothetical protein